MTLRITAEGVAKHIQSIYRNTSPNDDDQNQTLIDNVYFVTMKFDGVDLNRSRSSPSTYLNQYGEWYHRVMQDSFGKHLGRKRRLQPLSYAFIDIPGSRYRRSCSTDPEANAGLYERTQHRGAVEYLNSGLLHVHGVIALVPGPGQACLMPMVTSPSLPRTRELGDIEISRFDPSRGSLQNLIEYSMKGAVQVGSLVKEDCWGLFPH